MKGYPIYGELSIETVGYLIKKRKNTPYLGCFILVGGERLELS